MSIIKKQLLSSWGYNTGLLANRFIPLAPMHVTCSQNCPVIFCGKRRLNNTNSGHSTLLASDFICYNLVTLMKGFPRRASQCEHGDQQSQG